MKNKILGEETSWYMLTALGLLSLSSLNLIFHKHPYDFLVILASLYRLTAYVLVVYAIFYINVRKEAVKIMEEAANVLKDILKAKPIRKKDILYLKLDNGFSYLAKAMFLYDLDAYKQIAVVSGQEEVEIPKIDLKNLGDKEFDKNFHYRFYKNYLLVSQTNFYPESPLLKLHLINLEGLMLGYILEWINFERYMEEKSKEIERLYLLLETSEDVVRAYNRIETFSKRVMDRLDRIFEMDGSFFYIWNKNSEALDKLVFSNEFLKNLSDADVYRFLEDVTKDPETHGIRGNYMYCKVDNSLYQVGIVGLRQRGELDKEELFFFKTISNQLFSMVKIIKVIEDLERAHADIRFLTEHDPLTMLYNRKSLEALLEREIERSIRSGEPLCILFMDVDNLRVINSTYGYHIGDLVLRYTADIIRKSVRRVDIPSRVGGDEFLILLPGTNKLIGKNIAERLRKEFVDNVFVIGDNEIHISLSIGVLCYPVDVKRKEEILPLAEAFLSIIKKEGKGKVKAIEERDLPEKVEAILRKVEQRTLEAFEKRAVEIFLQEIVNLHNESISGFEVLMRLRVDGELMPAGSFMPTAEEMGIIGELDKVLIEGLFRRISNMEGDFIFFINLSPKELTDEFTDWIVSTTNAYKIDTQRIVFEITEREAIQDLVKTSVFIRNMREAGFKFAIDDFGSGYSSFIYLKYLPVDFLKIDGEFVKSLKGSSVDKVFVKSIVDMAKALNIKTVAEHVEDGEILSILLDLGVDFAQGYYIGKPGTMEEKLKKVSSSKEEDRGLEGIG
ncbi:MAG: putative bifunctional diguanylate cyclase/phosphodiesterase [Aquificaceae bacterium]